MIETNYIFTSAMSSSPCWPSLTFVEILIIRGLRIRFSYVRECERSLKDFNNIGFVNATDLTTSSCSVDKVEETVEVRVIGALGPGLGQYPGQLDCSSLALLKEIVC